MLLWREIEEGRHRKEGKERNGAPLVATQPTIHEMQPPQNAAILNAHDRRIFLISKHPPGIMYIHIQRPMYSRFCLSPHPLLVLFCPLFTRTPTITFPSNNRTMQQPPSPPHHSNTTPSLPKKLSVEEVYKCKDATSQSLPQATHNSASPSSSTTLPPPYPDDDKDHHTNASSEEEDSLHLDCSYQTLEWCRQQEASAALHTLIQDASLPILRPPRPGFPLLVPDMDRTLVDGNPIGKQKIKLCFLPSSILSFHHFSGLFNPIRHSTLFPPSLPPSLPFRPAYGPPSARFRVSVARLRILGPVFVDQNRP